MPSGGAIQTTILYDKSSESLGELAKKVEATMRVVLQKGVILGKFRQSDFRETLVHSDIIIHLGQPFYAATNWAHVKCIIKGSADWIEEAHAAYLPAFDVFLNETSATEPFEELTTAVKDLVRLVGERRPSKGNFVYPPILLPADCPPISVITPTYNRRDMIDIAMHNLMATDYPQDRIEWVVVEDCDASGGAADSTKMASDKIMSFQVNCPSVKLKYIPLSSRTPVGEKRDIGVEHCSNDIVLFMDDDDHYPPTSFRRRVAWLLHGNSKGGAVSIAACTTIALYDLKRGVSAVNMPPMNLPLSKRISEATLTFKKSAWVERKFGTVDVAEGDEWIKGREMEVLELMPQHIIVAFSHDKNLSGRRIPPVEANVGCFWGFTKEYLIFIHKLAGVEIEEVGGGSGSSSSSGRSKHA
jgi:hypothetical protein